MSGIAVDQLRFILQSIASQSFEYCCTVLFAVVVTAVKDLNLADLVDLAHNCSKEMTILQE